MAITIFAVSPVYAAKSITCGENLTWTLDDEGTLTISGTGEMAFESKGSLIFIPWYGKQIKKVIIEEGVTSIAYLAFSGYGDVEYNKSIISISLPSSLKKIGPCAFQKCTGLESVIIPGSVTEIGDSAFSGCTSLKNVEFMHSTQGLSRIQQEVFRDCISLKNIKIPYSVKFIEHNAFYGCTGLTEMDLNNVEELDNGAFFECHGLETVIMRKALKSFSALSFECCENLKKIYIYDNDNYTVENNVIFNKDKTTLVMYLPTIQSENYNIPNSVKEISFYAFFNAKHLKSINVSEGVTTIERYAFSGTSLENIILPRSILYVKTGAIGVGSIKDIYYCGNEKEWEKIDFAYGYDDMNMETLERATIHYNYSNKISGTCGEDLTWTLDNKGTLTISGTGTMQEISEENKMWEDYKDEITSVIIEAGATDISAKAFQNCMNLKNVDIPNTVTEIGDSSFLGTGIEKIEIPGSVKKINALAFGSCPLTEIKFNEGLIEIGSHVFKMSSNLIEIRLPDSVEMLDGTFAYSYIKNIFIPKKAKFISDGVLNFTYGAESVTVDEENPYYSSYDGALYNKDKTTLIACPWQKKGTLRIADGTLIIDDIQNTEIDKIIIPKSVTSINNCFNFSDGLSESLLTDIYYEGSETDWNNITVNHGEFCEGNHLLVPENVKLHCMNSSLITVSVNADNGTVTGTGIYAKGANVTLTAAPNSGYRFTGWYVDDAAVSTESTYTFTADNDIALTAKFERDRSSRGGGGGSSSAYTIKFNTNGGSELKNISVKSGRSIGTITEPKKDGYIFTGWYSDKELTKSYNKDEKVTASATLYAGWKIDPVRQLILTIGKKDAAVFGKTKSNDVAPKIVNGRTMLPARFVAESLGAVVAWNAEKQEVTIKGKNAKDEDITILIYIDSDIAYVNDEQFKLDSPAFIENDRTYTPVRFISEQLGASVEWNEADKTVTITK